MDLRRLNFPEYGGDRLTLRMHHRDRQELRRLAEQEGTTESALAREAIALLIELFSSDKN